MGVNSNLENLLKKFARIVGASVVCLSILFVFRKPILRGVSEAWYVEHEFSHADCAVVLGGAQTLRAEAAANLYLEGKVDVLLIMREHPLPEVELGLREGQFQIALEILDTMGVPEAAIEVTDSTVLSTRDEAVEVRKFADANPGCTFVIPTDPSHTRRAHWIVKKALKHTGSDVVMTCVEPVNYQRDTWWQSEHGVTSLFSEFFKFAYYQLRYAGDRLSAN